MAKRRQRTNQPISEKRLEKKTTLSIVDILFIVFASLEIVGIELTLFPGALNVASSKALVAHVFLIPLMIVWAYKSIKEGGFKFLWGLPLLSILIYLAYLVLNTVFIAPFKFASWYYLRVLFTAVLVFFMGTQLSQSRVLYRSVLYSLLFSILIAAILGILSAYNIKPISWVTLQNGRICSTLGNPTFLATTLALGVCITIYFFISTPNPLLRVLFVMTGLILITTLYYTQARAGTLSLVIILVGTAIYFIKSRTKRIIVGLSAVSLVILTFLTFFFFEEKIPYLGEGRGTMKIRKVIWSTSLRMWRSAPIFGVGTANFQIFFPQFRDPFYSFKGVSNNTLNAENELLEVLGTIGLIGLAMVLLIVYTWFRGFFISPLILKLDKEDSLFFSMIGIGLIGALTDMQLGVGMRIFSVLTTILLFGGLFVGIYRNTKSWKEFSFKEKPSLKPKFLAGIIIICILCVFYIFQDIDYTKAEYYGSYGNFYMNEFKNKFEGYKSYVDGNMAQKRFTPFDSQLDLLESGLTHLERSVKYDPYYFYSWYRIGGIQTRIADWYEFIYMYHRFIGGEEVLGDRESYLERAREHLVKAKDTYLHLKKICPNYAMLHHDMAVTYLKLDEFENALPELVIAAKQNYIEAYSYMIEIGSRDLAEEYQTPETRRCYFDILPVMPTIYPDQTKVRFDIADKNLFNKYIKEKVSGKKPYHTNIHDVIERMKEFEYTISELPYAIAQLETVVSKRSYDLDSSYRLYGQLLALSGRLDEAEQAHLIALNLEPAEVENILAATDFYLLYRRDLDKANKIIVKSMVDGTELARRGIILPKLINRMKIRRGILAYYNKDDAAAYKLLSQIYTRLNLMPRDKAYNDGYQIYLELKNKQAKNG